MAKKAKISTLLAALVVVIGGGALFVGATAGWFGSPKVSLDPDAYCTSSVSECVFTADILDPESFEAKAAAGSSFILLVSQPGCQTADRIRQFLDQFTGERGIAQYFEIDFSDLKETAFYPAIKFYPSIAIIEKGKLRAHLRADSDEDAPAYNDEQAFYAWMDTYLAAEPQR